MCIRHLEGQKSVKFYIVTGVSEALVPRPRTRKEIAKVRWIATNIALNLSAKSGAPFSRIAPLVPAIKRWLQVLPSIVDAQRAQTIAAARKRGNVARTRGAASVMKKVMPRDVLKSLQLTDSAYQRRSGLRGLEAAESVEDSETDSDGDGSGDASNDEARRKSWEEISDGTFSSDGERQGEGEEGRNEGKRKMLGKKGIKKVVLTKENAYRRKTGSVALALRVVPRTGQVTGRLGAVPLSKRSIGVSTSLTPKPSRAPIKELSHDSDVWFEDSVPPRSRQLPLSKDRRSGLAERDREKEREKGKADREETPDEGEESISAALFGDSAPRRKASAPCYITANLPRGIRSLPPALRKSASLHGVGDISQDKWRHPNFPSDSDSDSDSESESDLKGASARVSRSDRKVLVSASARVESEDEVAEEVVEVEDCKLENENVKEGGGERSTRSRDGDENEAEGEDGVESCDLSAPPGFQRPSIATRMARAQMMTSNSISRDPWIVTSKPPPGLLLPGRPGPSHLPCERLLPRPSLRGDLPSKTAGKADVSAPGRSARTNLLATKRLHESRQSIDRSRGLARRITLTRDQSRSGRNFTSVRNTTTFRSIRSIRNIRSGHRDSLAAADPGKPSAAAFARVIVLKRGQPLPPLAPASFGEPKPRPRRRDSEDK